LIRRGLRPAFGRVFPRFLTTVRCEVKQSEMGVEQLAAAGGGEVCAVYAVLIITNEHIDGKPLPRIEGVGEAATVISVPGSVPAHPLLQGNDLVLRCR